MSRLVAQFIFSSWLQAQSQQVLVEREKWMDRASRVGQPGGHRSGRGLAEELEDDPTISATAIAHEPPSAARKEAENNLALEYRNAGKLELAFETWKHLTESAPNHVLAFNNLAALLCELKRYTDAEAVQRTAIRTHPFSFKANLLLATALIRQGHYTPEARLDLQYAEAKYPEAKQLLDNWPVK